MDKKDLIDPIEQAFERMQGQKPDNSLELFTDNKTGDIALKTDLIHLEHVLVSCLITENELINEELQGFDLYFEYLEQFRRHKVSLDRKSRGEFVRVNDMGSSDRNIEQLSHLKNLTDAKK